MEFRNHDRGNREQNFFQVKIYSEINVYVQCALFFDITAAFTALSMLLFCFELVSSFALFYLCSFRSSSTIFLLAVRVRIKCIERIQLRIFTGSLASFIHTY